MFRMRRTWVFKMVESMRIIDLSKIINPQTAVYPGDAKVHFETEASFDEQGYCLTRMHLSTHTGTHIDAPRHFLKEGCGVTGLALEAFVGPAVLLDLRPLMLQPGQEITPQTLEPHRDAFQRGARVIINTGWTEICPPDAADHFTDHPVFTPQAIHWIADRRPLLVGMDLPSPHSQLQRATHEPLLRAGIVLLEGLINLSSLPREFTLIALPLALENLDGSPVRAVAMIPPRLPR
ncbi:MAG TPA: hypothetical protein DDZ65_01035 [Firmicutes bacterium]|nr:hypothetical protein [Bacillota bacterium]